MRIIGLEAENFKRIRAVSLRPDGHAVVIGGQNGAGKSSVIDSIEAALGGKGAAPAEPVRRGEDHARVVVDLGDIVVKRTFSENGSKLVVTSKEGAVFQSPQTMLDKLVGALSFDPLRFSRMEPKEQVATLRALVGLDFTAMDEERARVFAERTEVTRTVKSLRAMLDGTPDNPDAPNAEVSVSLLTEELQSRRAKNEAKRTATIELEGLRAQGGTLVDRIDVLKEQLKMAQEQLEEVKAKGIALRAQVDAMQGADEAAILEQLKFAEATNAKVRAKQQRAKLADELGHAGTNEADLTRRIAAIDEKKQEMLAAAKFQVPGLAFDDNGVTLNGLPFKQASSAEQLRASVAIGIATNKDLRILLIRDGALLDDASLSFIAKQAADADAQLWVEVVGREGTATVVIEDGSVRGSEAKGAA